MKSDSGQMTVDYIAGITIFLLAVIFVFNFVYGLFVPFQSGSDKNTLAADRVSTILVEQMLHADTSGTLNVIDQRKLYNFNNTLNCSNTSYKNEINTLGLNNGKTFFDMQVNVTYLNGTIMNQSFTYPNGTVVDYNPKLPLASGCMHSDNTDTALTKRLVLIINSSTGYNQSATLSVIVW